jgi:hypothetical protein
MCLPTNSEKSSNTASQTRSIFGLGALMLLACLAGPAIARVVGAIGLGVVAGARGVVVALALCAAVPAVAVAWRRRSARDLTKPDS